MLYGHAVRGRHPAANWLLHRDERVGCAAFGPTDAEEVRRIPAWRRPLESVMDVELFLAPWCPNAAATRAVLTACLHRSGLDARVRERVGDYPSPTILVDGVDVMTRKRGAPSRRACRLDVPTAARVLAALHGRPASSTSEDVACRPARTGTQAGRRWSDQYPTAGSPTSSGAVKGA